MAILVQCGHCDQKSAIRSSKKISSELRLIYTDCQNDLCLAREVWHLSKSHDLQPPISNSTQIDLVACAISDWSDEQRARLFKKFGHNPDTQN